MKEMISKKGKKGLMRTHEERRSGFRPADEDSIVTISIPFPFCMYQPIHISRFIYQSSHHLGARFLSWCPSRGTHLIEHQLLQSSSFWNLTLLHALRIKFSWWRLCCTTTISHESQYIGRWESIAVVIGLPVARQRWGLSACSFILSINRKSSNWTSLRVVVLVLLSHPSFCLCNAFDIWMGLSLCWLYDIISFWSQNKEKQRERKQKKKQQIGKEMKRARKIKETGLVERVT